MKQPPSLLQTKTAGLINGINSKPHILFVNIEKYKGQDNPALYIYN